jgi:hypothetical protein
VWRRYARALLSSGWFLAAAGKEVKMRAAVGRSLDNGGI